MAESSRPSAPTSGMETLGKAGAGPLGKAASAGTEATAAVMSVTAVTSAPAAAVTVVMSTVPGPKGPVEGPSGAAGSGTTPEDNRPVCFKCGAKGHYRTNCPVKKDTKTKIQMPRECCLETIHLVIMNESLGKAASAGTSATAVTSALAAAVTAVTAVTSAVPGPKGPVAGPSGAAGSGTTPEDNRPVKILLNLRRQFTAYKGNVLNYCMTVKRVKFKLIRIKAWTLGSCLIERLNSLQACRTSRSCGRVHQVEVVDLVGVYHGKSGSPKTIRLAITNRLSRSPEGSMVADDAQAAVTEKVVGRVGVDDDQSGLPECSEAVEVYDQVVGAEEVVGLLEVDELFGFLENSILDLGRQLFRFSGISILDLGGNYCIQRKV